MERSDEQQQALAVEGFWTWLVKPDEDGDRGLGNVLNKWLLVHVFVGGVLAWCLKAPPVDLAKSIALPGAAILVGLAFGWAGRSASILQDKEFSRFIIDHGPSAESYVYAFQLAVLAVLIFIATALVILAGGTELTLGTRGLDDLANRFLLFFLGSVAARESWGIIYFVNKLTIQFYTFRKNELERAEVPPGQ